MVATPLIRFLWKTLEAVELLEPIGNSESPEMNSWEVTLIQRCPFLSLLSRCMKIWDGTRLTTVPLNTGDGAKTKAAILLPADVNKFGQLWEATLIIGVLKVHLLPDVLLIDVAREFVLWPNTPVLCLLITSTLLIPLEEEVQDLKLWTIALALKSILIDIVKTQPK